MDARTLHDHLMRILASQQPDHDKRRQLLEQVQAAVRSHSMTGAVLQQLCAAVLASDMPRDSQRYFLSAAFEVCKPVLAVEDVVALREAICSQGWETIASLQVLANLYLAASGCLSREAALTEWAAAKAAHPQDPFSVRQWVGQALQRHAPRSAFT